MSGQQNTEPAAAELATVGAKYTDGLSLIFDENMSALYRMAFLEHRQVEIQAGDRVKICRISGTYVVEYVVGNPK